MSEGENKVAEIIFKDLIKELSRTKEKIFLRLKKPPSTSRQHTHISFIYNISNPRILSVEKKSENY